MDPVPLGQARRRPRSPPPPRTWRRVRDEALRFDRHGVRLRPEPADGGRRDGGAGDRLRGRVMGGRCGRCRGSVVRGDPVGGTIAAPTHRDAGIDGGCHGARHVRRLGDKQVCGPACRRRRTLHLRRRPPGRRRACCHGGRPERDRRARRVRPVSGVARDRLEECWPGCGRRLVPGPAGRGRCAVARTSAAHSPGCRAATQHLRVTPPTSTSNDPDCRWPRRIDAAVVDREFSFGLGTSGAADEACTSLVDEARRIRLELLSLASARAAAEGADEPDAALLASFDQLASRLRGFFDHVVDGLAHADVPADLDDALVAATDAIEDVRRVRCRGAALAAHCGSRDDRGSSLGRPIAGGCRLVAGCGRGQAHGSVVRRPFRDAHLPPSVRRARRRLSNGCGRT